MPFKSLHKLYSQHSTFLGRSVISLNATPRSGPKWLSVQLLVVVEVGHLLPFLWCGVVDLCLCTKLGLLNNCKRAAASVVADDVCPVGVGEDCVCCIVPRLWFCNICGRLGRRRSTILEMSLSDIYLTVFLWSSLVILRVSPFHSPNSLGIYHKMYTFSSFFCSGQPDMWYLCKTGLWHARLSCSEDFQKREYFQPMYFRLYNMLSFKWHICSNLQPVFASS